MSGAPVMNAETSTPTSHEPDTPDTGGASSSRDGAATRAEGADQHGADDEEEVEPARLHADPGEPTERMREEHRDAAHMPFRSWCAECVAGRGTGEQHRSKSEANKIPVLAFDYLIINRNNEVYIQDEGKEVQADSLKLLVAKDTFSKATFVHAVKNKGPGEDRYAVNCLVEDLKFLGYHRVGLKCDNEPAILKLLSEVLVAQKVQVDDMEHVKTTHEEHPTAYDKGSNGFIENAIRTVQGLIRTLKLELELCLGVTIPSEHPLLRWLAEHAAWQLTTRSKGEDGLTPYSRLRGKNYAKRLVRFGERVLYKLPSDGPAAPADKLQPYWRHGYVLGYSRNSPDYAVLNEETGVVKVARSIQKIPRGERWRVQALENLTVTPQSLMEPVKPEVVFGPGEVRQARQDQQRAPQRVILRQSDFDQNRGGHGYTLGCGKCDHAVKWGWGKTSVAHSAACVARISEELAKTPQGRARLDKAVERAMKTAIEEVDAAAAEGELGAEGETSERPRTQPDDAERIAFRRTMACPAAEQPDHQGGGDNPLPIQDGGENIPFPIQIETQMHDEGDVEPENIEHEAPRDADLQGGNDAIAEPGMDLDLVETDNTMRRVCMADARAAKELQELDDSILTIVESLGAPKRGYRRERNKTIKKIVSEIYSPARVTQAAKMLPSLRLLPGFAFDLTTSDENGVPWDFSKAERRQKARRLIEEQKPYVVVGSPECTKYCAWQRINNLHRDPAIVARERAAADVHLAFVCEIYRLQLDSGRYFLHEHPDSATSWTLKCVKEVMAHKDVRRVIGDQCQYGQETDAGKPMRKRTGWMSNSKRILDSISKTCTGKNGQCSRAAGGEHEHVRGKHGRKAAIYPFRLCKAILTGAKAQLVEDEKYEVGIHCVLPGPIAEKHDDEENAEINNLDEKNGVYKDNLTGQPLIPELVKQARLEELKYFKSKSVWELRGVDEAKRRQGKVPISVRWIDVNKGDDMNPKYRSRLVAREIRRAGEDPIFAPTPPLESVRTILSLAATDIEGEAPHIRDPESEMRTQVQFIDIARAYFCAKTDPADPTYERCLPSTRSTTAGNAVSCCATCMAHGKQATDGIASVPALLPS